MAQKAIGYVRVSTEEQAREGVSLAAQEEKIRAYVALADLELVAVVRDEGVSGAVPLSARTGGAALTAAALRRVGVGHVVALKLDRLFRDAVDALEQTRAWDRTDIALHLIDQGGTALSTASAMGRFFLSVMASFAELEKNLIGERTANALAHIRGRGGIWNHAPFGLHRVGDRLEEDPAEMATVRRIQAEAEAGASLQAIARGLRRDKVPTKRLGATWHASTVRGVLRSPLFAPRI